MHAPKMNMNTNKGYKTSLCKNYMEGGNCHFGPKCTFAHGPLELRSGMDNGPPPMPMQHTPNPKYNFTSPNPKYIL